VREPLLFATPPRANATRTSLAAADQVADRCPTCRERIAAFLRAVGPGGATHEEIAGNTGVRLDTVKPRVHELGELGQVVALRQTRRSTAGAAVLVFVAAEHACGRELEPWPVRRIDWRARALDAERRAAEAERRLRELEQQGV
jgi:hypothetical protein